MAEEAAPTWTAAIDAALATNNGTPKPKTLRGLARALVNERGSNRNEESWFSTLKKVRRDDDASEAVASLIASALGVPREQLPPKQRLTLKLVYAELVALRDRVAELERLSDSQSLDPAQRAADEAATKAAELQRERPPRGARARSSSKQ